MRLHLRYMQRNQRDKLLRLRRPDVTTFLENHPDMLWVDQSERECYLDAAKTLLGLASAEKDQLRWLFVHPFSAITANQLMIGLIALT